MSHLADFGSHHIEGYAHAALAAGRRGDFKVPLISQIDGNLWMGGCKHGVQLDGFMHVISLYPWERYKLAAGTRLLEVKLYDSAQLADEASLRKIAGYVNASRDEGRTLVHCQAGLNRSGLITALALVMDGMEPTDAIALLREKRHPVVLCNETFERFLLGLEAGSGTANPRPDLPDVRVGQVWADCDRRSAGRLVRVIAAPSEADIASVPNPGYFGVRVEVIASRDGASGPEDARTRGRRLSIRLNRFRPTSSGYRLVEDAS